MELHVELAMKIIILVCYILICLIGWKGFNKREDEFVEVERFIHTFTLSLTFIGVPIVFYYLFKFS